MCVWRPFTWTEFSSVTPANHADDRTACSETERKKIQGSEKKQVCGHVYGFGRLRYLLVSHAKCV